MSAVGVSVVVGEVRYEKREKAKDSYLNDGDLTGYSRYLC